MCFYKKIENLEELKGTQVNHYQAFWKVFMVEEGILISPFRRYSYEVGRSYDLWKLLPTVHNMRGRIYISITEGFHGYIKKKEAQIFLETLQAESPNKTFTMRLCAIHPGTVYYTNEDGELVTAQLRVLDKEEEEELCASLKI